MPRSRLLQAAVCLILAACHTPPLPLPEMRDIPSARRCAALCDKQVEACRQACGQEHADCVKREQENAESDYRAYANRQWITGRSASKSEGDFFAYYACKPGGCLDTCGQSQRQCYLKCNQGAEIK